MFVVPAPWMVSVRLAIEPAVPRSKLPLNWSVPPAAVCTNELAPRNTGPVNVWIAVVELLMIPVEPNVSPKVASPTLYALDVLLKTMPTTLLLAVKPIVLKPAAALEKFQISPALTLF